MPGIHALREQQMPYTSNRAQRELMLLKPPRAQGDLMLLNPPRAQRVAEPSSRTARTDTVDVPSRTALEPEWAGSSRTSLG